MRIRLLLAGEDEDTSSVIQAVLRRDRDLEVAGTARTGRELVLLLLEARPSVVLVDLAAPWKDTVATAVQLARLQEMPTRFLGLAGSSRIDESLLARLDEVLYRDASVEGLLAAVRRVAAVRDSTGAARPQPPQPIIREAPVPSAAPEVELFAGSDIALTLGSSNLIVSPFDNFRSLVAFQQALEGLEDVRSVRVRRFHRGTLYAMVRYDGVLPLEERLKKLVHFSPRVVASRPGCIELQLGKNEGPAASLQFAAGP